MATVRKRGKSYQIRVSCGYDIAGKQIVKTLNWTPPDGLGARQLKKELDRQTVLFEEKCRNRVAPSGSIKLADYIDQWFIDYAEMRLKGTTVSGYAIARLPGSGICIWIRSHLTISMPFTII